MKELDLPAKHLKIVLDILKKNVPEAEVWVFGSRVQGMARKHSDLDLALVSKKPLPLKKMAQLRDAFSDSSLPIKVDIVELNNVSENFRKINKENSFVLKKRSV